MNGSVGEMHAKKIVHLYDLALKVGAPVIGLVDCAGLRLQEATDAADRFGSQLGDVDTGLSNVEEGLNDVEDGLEDVGSQAGRMGAQFQEAFGTSLKAGDSFGKSLKTGIGAGFDYVEKRAKSFFDSCQDFPIFGFLLSERVRLVWQFFLFDQTIFCFAIDLRFVLRVDESGEL